MVELNCLCERAGLRQLCRARKLAKAFYRFYCFCGKHVFTFSLSTCVTTIYAYANTHWIEILSHGVIKAAVRGPLRRRKVALDRKRAYHVHPSTPEWRNWYTHQTQNLARFTPHVGSSPTSGTKPSESVSKRLLNPITSSFFQLCVPEEAHRFVLEIPKQPELVQKM